MAAIEGRRSGRASQTLNGSPLRLPAARRFDRNCVLAATAGQIIAADALGLEIAAIVVGKTIFDVGPVARDIRLAAPRVNRDAAVIAAAGTLGFSLAAGMTVEEVRAGLEGEALAVSMDAWAMLAPWLIDGRLARLVRQLDVLRFSGTRTLH